MGVVVFKMQPPLTASTDVSDKTPTVNILLYAGEISQDKYAFGTTRDSLSSPGPTLRFNTSDVVNITVVNVGKFPYAFAITTSPRTGAPVLFNATIGSADNPIQPGQSDQILFSPNEAGSTFFYTCPVPGCAEAGMYGSVVITVSGSGIMEM